MLRHFSGIEYELIPVRWIDGNREPHGLSCLVKRRSLYFVNDSTAVRGQLEEVCFSGARRAHGDVVAVACGGGYGGYRPGTGRFLPRCFGDP